MAGVAGPMLQRSKLQGTRFLLGLLVGGLGAAALLASIAYGLGELIAWAVPTLGRQIAAGLVLLVLGIADARDRTWHVWRQVPQAYVRKLAPGRLGLVWGFDLGLLFTTQKSTSLTWGALVGVVLLAPSSAWLVLPGMTTVGMAVISVRSIWFMLTRPSWRGDRGRRWHGRVRLLSGAGLVVLAAAATAGAGWV
ncbi:hypothetical protein [Yinghuangia seranimata]|uniref:hypothetical protein n=1 Tax=Yinghuangia seranimata TaxID=408067 RepID=UPI00248B6CC0|nr:hypothetical protein [Yinghuangia seranimata]MDI2131064.1 hypothetical protein [Yinghuangia seranimata]